MQVIGFANKRLKYQRYSGNVERLFSNYSTILSPVLFLISVNDITLSLECE